MKENLIENHWDQFLIDPLAVVDRLYNQMNGESSVEEFHCLIKEQLASLLEANPSYLQQIPYLNNRNTNYDNLKNKSLVRYRCMIQDMFNPEIYAAILNSQSGKKINLYTDSVYLDEKYFVNPGKNTIMDRFIYYMISIPGVNQWVRDAWDREGRTENVSQPTLGDCSHNSSFKRSLDEELAEQNEEMADEEGAQSSNKKKKVSQEAGSNAQNAEPNVCSKKKDYCTPIKSEEELNRPVIVKVYDTKELDVKLNDLVEVVGIIEFPNFENRNHHGRRSSGAKDDQSCPEIASMLGDLDLDHEDYTYSELPRIHALNIRQLTSINPYNEFNAQNCREKSSSYGKLINLFEKMFFGDKLTTQYFVCWLVSRVYKVQDSLPIGNFPINISNLNAIPNEEHAAFIQRFYAVLEGLCTHSLKLPVTISELNNRILNPYKDKDNTKLQSGLLQLPSNFSLVLDETALMPGNLKEMGLKNLTTIKGMIAWQSIEYDHLFYTQRINSDINVLVFSEGKSLFDVSCEVRLKVSDLSGEFSDQLSRRKFPFSDPISWIIATNAVSLPPKTAD